MSVAPGLMNCRVNTTYFVKNNEILFKYFEENEEQIPWKHELFSYMRMLYFLLFWRFQNFHLVGIFA